MPIFRSLVRVRTTACQTTVCMLLAFTDCFYVIGSRVLAPEAVRSPEWSFMKKILVVCIGSLFLITLSAAVWEMLLIVSQIQKIHRFRTSILEHPCIYG